MKIENSGGPQGLVAEFVMRGLGHSPSSGVHEYRVGAPVWGVGVEAPGTFWLFGLKWRIFSNQKNCTFERHLGTLKQQ